MYDSLTLWQPIEEIKDSGYYSRVPTLLNNVGEHINENGEIYITGHLKNFRIYLSERGISVKGSLNKFYHEDNFNKLTRQQTELSFEKLNDSLKIDFSNSTLRRIDLAHNFIMTNEVESYYNFLGDSQYYKRLTQPNSIYYRNEQRTKLFYNKVLEGKKKGIEIPEIWTSKNVLRYELRFMNRIAKQLNMTRVIAKDLYQEAFYIDLIDRWIQEYFLIRKNKLLTPKIGNMTSKGAKEYLLSALIEIVGQNEVNQLAVQWRENFSTPKEAQRFKRSLKDLKGLTEESELIQELDKKILRVKEHYR